MLLSTWCILIAISLAYAPRMLVPLTILKDKKKYDNHHPRQQQTQLEGLAARAQAAHLNGLETFPFFAAAVLYAQQNAPDQDLVNTLAVAFVALRVLYIALYLGNIATPRSLVWTVSFSLCFALFLLQLFGS